jgi:hypothetical protein
VAREINQAAAQHNAEQARKAQVQQAQPDPTIERERQLAAAYREHAQLGAEERKAIDAIA